MTTIVQQSLFEFILYIAITILSFYSVKTFPVIFILLSLFYFGQIFFRIIEKMVNQPLNQSTQSNGTYCNV